MVSDKSLIKNIVSDGYICVVKGVVGISFDGGGGGED